jgi:tRNA dimethylallyltransferase
LNTFPTPALLNRSWFLTGPTASGKTAVSLHLAKMLDAEIISLDSMTIYRGMDIGTAKLSHQDRQQIPHHLIDIADPSEEFSVADFVARAIEAGEDILARNRVPLFVGGTGLYLRSVLRGISEGPAPDWNLRNELQEQALLLGPDWLYQQLNEIDPATAARLHPQDMRRIIRAIEVHRLTGRKLSDDQSQGPRPLNERPRAVVWLEPPRPWLHQRINQRVEQMIHAGWLEETRQLLQRIPPCSRTARQALGYQDLIEVLEGTLSLEDAVIRIQTTTRQFAKRQHTWFRNLEECRPLKICGTETAQELSEQILNMAGPQATL